MFSLGERSRSRLTGVHPDLVKLVEHAIKLSTVDFAVVEGVRARDRQIAMVKAGASQTMNSRHLTGHAVDLGAWVDNQIDWSWPLYSKISDAMLKASKELRIPVEWGGNWTRFKDGPHFQLPWKEYP